MTWLLKILENEQKKAVYREEAAFKGSDDTFDSYFKKMIFRDFPGGPVVKNPRAGVMGSIPDPEKLPHAVEQLSLCAATTEPMSHNYCSQRTYSPCFAARVATTKRSCAS